MLTPISIAEQKLALAKSPEESKEVEALAAAAIAWAKEQENYELIVDAWRAYVLARSKTTELILPDIKQGRPENKPDNDVKFLSDYGFTYKQWERRRRELRAKEVIDDYLDDCLTNFNEPTIHGLLKFAGGPHVSHNSGNNEWYTPKPYISAAVNVMGVIDLDPASSDEANEIVGASEYYTEEDDGLQHDWSGRVWMNPPYASELIGKFTNKIASHYESGDISQALVLVNNATETGWYQRMLDCATAICLIRGRVKFIDEHGNPSGAPLQGQTVLYFGDDLEVFSNEFQRFGKIVWTMNGEK